MEINTDVNFGELPENDPTLQSMTEEERAVYWSAVQDLIEATSGVKQFKEKRGEIGITDSELSKYRTQFIDAVSIIELLEDMSEARQCSASKEITIGEQSEVQKDE